MNILILEPEGSKRNESPLLDPVLNQFSLFFICVKDVRERSMTHKDSP
jgi:hypothetical protein